MAGCSERYVAGILVGACILHVAASIKSQALLFYPRLPLTVLAVIIIYIVFHKDR